MLCERELGEGIAGEKPLCEPGEGVAGIDQVLVALRPGDWFPMSLSKTQVWSGVASVKVMSGRENGMDCVEGLADRLECQERVIDVWR